MYRKHGVEAVPLPQEAVNRIFEDAQGAEEPHQLIYVLGLYKHVFTDEVWRAIKSVGLGAVTVSEKTNRYIFAKAMEFDRRYHKGVLRGGLWMNNGFNSVVDKLLEDIEVDDWFAYVNWDAVAFYGPLEVSDG